MSIDNVNTDADANTTNTRERRSVYCNFDNVLCITENIDLGLIKVHRFSDIVCDTDLRYFHTFDKSDTEIVIAHLVGCLSEDAVALYCDDTKNEYYLCANDIFTPSDLQGFYYYITDTDLNTKDANNDIKITEHDYSYLIEHADSLRHVKY